MKKTLQQLIAQDRVLISQSDTATSDFTDAELRGFNNEGLQFIAAKIEWPRDQVSYQAEVGVPSYPLLSDTLKIRTAYFGNVSIARDMTPLTILDESQLKEIVPGWLDQTTQSRGKPSRIILLDRKTILVHPTPDADNSASGKKIYLGYVYYPASLAADGDYPDLPDIYHDELKLYVGHLCYMGKLKKPALATSMLDMLIKKIDLLKPPLLDGFEEKSWQWGDYDGQIRANNGLADLTLG